MKQLLLTIEFSLLFLALPLTFAGLRFCEVAVPKAVIYIAILAVLLYAALLFAFTSDRGFAAAVKAGIPWKKGTFWLHVALFICFCIGLYLYMRTYEPGALFRFPKEKPLAFAVVCLLYPVISVAPQEFLYRLFFLERYKTVFPQTWVLIGMNALAFSVLHAYLLNIPALLLTFFGGLLFARNYTQNRSFLFVVIEHAFYGLVIFAFGFGRYFVTRIISYSL